MWKNYEKIELNLMDSGEKRKKIRLDKKISH